MLLANHYHPSVRCGGGRDVYAPTTQRQVRHFASALLRNEPIEHQGCVATRRWRRDL